MKVLIPLNEEEIQIGLRCLWCNGHNTLEQAIVKEINFDKVILLINSPYEINISLHNNPTKNFLFRFKALDL